MSALVKVAVVGCGVIGRVHVGVIDELAEAELVALIDVDALVSESLADYAEHELRMARPACFETLEQALLAIEIDLVVVSTPSGLHAAAAHTALAADKHVIVEKPLDVSLSRGRALLEQAARAAERGIVCSVISQHRFDPASVLVHDAVMVGGFGRLTSAVASIAWWRSQGYYDSGSWRGTWELDGGGALMNQSVHTVDLLLWMMGRPVEVFSFTGLLAHQRVEVEDTAVAVVRFESGALATIHATTAAYPGPGNRLQIHGDRGSGVIDSDVARYFHTSDPEHVPTAQMGTSFAEGNQVERVISAEENRAVTFVEGHLRQYRDVLEAIGSGGRPSVGVEDALHALAMVRSVYLSSQLGKPILFDDVLAGRYDEIERPAG